MAIRVVTPSVVAPVSLAEIKAHLHIVNSTEHDALLTTLVDAVSANLNGPEGWLGRSLVEQTLELNLDAFPSNELLLPFGPLQSVTSVKYDNSDGIEEILASSEYDIDYTQSKGGWLVPVSSWPSTYDAINAVRVEYVTGYPLTSGDVPTTDPSIKAAIMLMVANIFVHPEAVAESFEEVPFGVKFLLAPFRIFS